MRNSCFLAVSFISFETLRKFFFLSKSESLQVIINGKKTLIVLPQLASFVCQTAENSSNSYLACLDMDLVVFPNTYNFLHEQ